MIFQEMREKVAVITGATSGIGRASALLLAQHGVKVILAGRDDKRGYELQDEISSNGGSALFVKTDVSKYESVKNLMGKAQSPSFLRPKFGEKGRPGQNENLVNLCDLCGLCGSNYAIMSFAS